MADLAEARSTAKPVEYEAGMSLRCKFLDYEGTYPACSLQESADGTKFWLRPAPYAGAPTAVQFCALRGRLNDMLACTSRAKALCSDYEAANGEVPCER